MSRDVIRDDLAIIFLLVFINTTFVVKMIIYILKYIFNCN